MKKALNKRNNLLNERMMKKWGYLVETFDTSSYSRDDEEIIVEEDPDTPQNTPNPQIEVPEVSGPDEFAENTVLHRMIYELSRKHNISLTEDQVRRIEEGTFDKLKARTSGMVGKVMGKDKGGQDFRKVDSLVKGKLKKINKLKTDILSDMGAMDLPMETADKISQVFAKLGTELGAVTARDHTGKKISQQVAQKTLDEPMGSKQLTAPSDAEKFSHPDDESARVPSGVEPRAGKTPDEVKQDVAARTDAKNAGDAAKTQATQLAAAAAGGQQAQAQPLQPDQTSKTGEPESGEEDDILFSDEEEWEVPTPDPRPADQQDADAGEHEPSGINRKKQKKDIPGGSRPGFVSAGEAGAGTKKEKDKGKAKGGSARKDPVVARSEEEKIYIKDMRDTGMSNRQIKKALKKQRREAPEVADQLADMKGAGLKPSRAFKKKYGLEEMIRKMLLEALNESKNKQEEKQHGKSKKKKSS